MNHETYHNVKVQGRHRDTERDRKREVKLHTNLERGRQRETERHGKRQIKSWRHSVREGGSGVGREVEGSVGRQWRGWRSSRVGWEAEGSAAQMDIGVRRSQKAHRETPGAETRTALFLHSATHTLTGRNNTLSTT